MSTISIIADLIRSEDGEIYWASEHGRPYDFRALAIAILRALREPTDAMLLAGTQHDDATYSAWQAMIDEALCDE